MKKTLKKLFRAEASRKLFIKLFRLYIKLLLKTISIEIKADQDFESFSKQVNDRGGPFLFLSHGILLVGCLCWFFLYSKKKFKHHGYSLISNSFDGEIISESIEPFGLKTVFGSSRKRQRDSFQEIIEIYSQGLTNVIVFDGPKGPPLIPKRGIQKYADSIEDFAGFLVICEPTNQLFFRLGSWDRFMIPLPFFRFKLTLKKIENFSTKQLEKEAKEAYGS